MQELRLVAVSEDGTYAVLTAPGLGGRFALPIDDRLRIVARGQFSRLAQYEIEVERPLRPKEIQDRIRAGETSEEIAEAAGVPIERVRRFEGPPLAERARWAQEAQKAAVRQPGDSGPGRALGDVVAERLAEFGADAESSEWDSRRRPDGTWLVQLTFASSGQPRVAEWLFDPRRMHASPADDTAAGLCAPDGELPDLPRPRAAATATVTPIASRLGTPPAAEAPPEPAPVAARPPAARPPAARPPAGRPAGGQPQTGRPAAAEREAGQTPPAPPARGRPARKAAGGRSRRSSVPSWDEIMFGTSRQSDEA